MPLVDYRCQECDVIVQDMITPAPPIGSFHERACPDCNSFALRRAIISVNTNGTHPHTRFIPHHNNATGTKVSSMRQFNDDLARKSEAASQYTGIDHEFVHVDSRDKEAFGVTDEGDYEGEKRQRELGNTQPVRSFWV